jgi:glycosyltransferase 2 family protein
MITMKTVKKTVFYFVLLFIGVALFVNVIIDTGVSNIIETIRDFSLAYFLLYFIVQFVNFVFLTWRWQVILHHYKSKVNFLRLILHRYAGWAVSFLTPSMQVGGEPVRVMLLTEDGVKKREAVCSVVVDKVVQLTGLIIFILLGFLFLISRQLVSGDIFWTLVISLAFFIGLLFWFYYASMKGIGFFSSILKLMQFHRFKRFDRTFEKVIVVEEALRDYYKGNWGKFLWLLFLSVLAEAYEMIEVWLIAHFMGVDLTFSQTFIARSLPCLAYLVPIPGALGVFEGSLAVVFALLGVNINAFVFAMIRRVRDLINVFIGLSHISGSGVGAVKKYLSKKWGGKSFKKRRFKLFG